MRDSRLQFACMSLAIVICAGSTAAGEYRDPAGFSFRYPDGWTTVTSRQVEADGKLTAPEVKAWLNKNRVDLKKISVVLIHEGEGEVNANLNVVVNQGQLRVDDHNAQELLKRLPEQYRSMGVDIENMKVRQHNFGNASALVVDYGMTMPSRGVPLKQRQAYFPGGGKTFIVTCTAEADAFEEYGPTFDTILASFQVPAPSSMGIDWTSALTAGAICGALAALLTVLKKLIGPKSLV
jgi:hypothetical protein